MTPVRAHFLRLLIVLALLIVNVSVLAQEAEQDAGEQKSKEKEEELTLEMLFPERGLFGPSARGMSISHDGRFGAYLWEPYLERRHGADLWIYDFESGESKRITKVSVMAEFQESTREVRKDRTEKAKKKKQKTESEKTETEGAKAGQDKTDEQKDVKKEEEEEKTEGEQDKEGDQEQHEEKDQEQRQEEIDLGDVVDDKDAEDEKAPRYSGIQSFEWAPHENSMIFISQGDLYQLEVASGAITRITRTAEPERSVQYLPDGAGYTYLRGNAVICVRFGSHLLEQLDPELPQGEEIQSYEISPDAKRLVFLAGKGQNTGALGDQVNIVSYRERFAQVREVRRHVPSSRYPEFEWAVYLYDLGGHMKEKGALKKVITKKQSGPRDIFRVPQWAPDSSKVAFAVFNQETSLVEIFEAGFEDKAKEAEEEKAEEGAAAAEGEGDGNGDGGDGDAQQQESPAEEKAEEEEPAFEITEARLVYKFFHNGGPNTPTLIQPQYLADSRRMVFLTEQSGFRHLHRLDPVYETLDQLTSGRFEVYPEDLSEDHATMFVSSNREHSSVENIYAVNVESGEMTRLTGGAGVYSGAAVSENGQHVLATYVDFGELRELRAIDRSIEAGPEKPITDSHPEKVKKLIEPIPDYFTFENRHGHTIHGHMFKPPDWTEQDQRPLLIYVYGGPLGGNSNQLSRGSYGAPSYFFAYYMAKKHGFVTCTIDPRGVSGYGALFEKSNFEHVGKPQVEDIVDCGKWMIANQGVDPKRIGMHGWSFGGFQTQMCLYTEPDFFACGIAGAGPTEWFNYNSWYTTGTIGPRQNVTDQNAAESDKYSLLPIAKNLKAKLLLIHGMEDSNVLYQDTVRVYRELLKAGKETLVELFLDPTGGHGLGGDVKTLGRYKKYEEFLVRCMGEGAPAEEVVENEAGDDEEKE